MSFAFLALFALFTPQWLSANQGIIAFGQSPQRNSEAERIYAEAKAALKEGTAESCKRALALFEQAARLYGAVGDKQHEAACLMGAGASAGKLGKWELVAKFSTDALPAIQAAKQTDIESVTWENIGLAWSALGEKSKAVEHFQRALALYRALTDVRGEAKALNYIGSARLHLQEDQQALECFEQARSVSLNAQDQRGEAAATYNIGQVWQMRRDYNEALDYYRRALALSQNAQDRGGEAKALGAIGVILCDIGRAQEGFALLKRSYELYQSLNDILNNIDQANSLFSAGVAVLNYQEFGLAGTFFYQALTLNRAIGNREGVANALNNLGKVAFGLGENKKALELHKDALLIYRELKNKRGEAVALNQIGGVLLALRDYRQALGVHRESLSLYRELNDQGDMAIILNNIGLASSKLGENQEALVALDESLRLRQMFQYPDHGGIASTLNNKGLVLLNLKQYANAADLFMQALSLYQLREDQEGEMVAFSNIAAALRELNQKNAANAYSKFSLNYLQKFRSRQRQMDKESQRAFLRKYEDPYSMMTDWLLSDDRLAEAQQAMHLARDQEFYDPGVVASETNTSQARLLRLTNAEKRLQDGLRKVLDGIKPIGDRLTQFKMQLDTRRPTPSETAQLKQLNTALAAESEKQQKLILRLNTDLNAAAAVDNRLSETEDLTDMQQTLRTLEQQTGTKAAAVYVLMGPEYCRTLLVTADAVSSKARPVKIVDLNQKSLTLLRLLQNDRYDPRQAGKALYDTLFEPIEADVRKSGVTLLLWSLDRNLRHVPMAALWDGKRYLAERFQHAVFTRPTPERMLRDVSRTWTGLGFGTSKAWAGLNPLPGVGRELRLIFGDARTRHKGVIPGQALQDEAFTKQSFLDGLKQGTPLVHIASHFRFRAGDDNESYLLLGNGERLPLGEMKKTLDLFKGVELLTLAACNTATQQGDEEYEREVDGFAEQAQRLGAGAVMASLWDVSDAITPELMAEFYRRRERGSGMTKAAALQQAQLALLNGTDIGASAANARRRTPELISEQGKQRAPKYKMDPKRPYAHPYYWAPFILIGNWR
jgi:CHAT domain-containing protein